jgi:copper(I)-binding protein
MTEEPVRMHLQRPRGRLVRLVAILSIAVSLVACAGSPGLLKVSDAWVRAVADVGQPSAAYLVIANGTGAADALLSVSTPAAGMAGLHETMTSGGMTSMTEIPRIDVPAGSTVQLAPGGRHVMLMQLSAPLVAGAKVELDLVFEHAGRVVVQAEVRQG